MILVALLMLIMLVVVIALMISDFSTTLNDNLVIKLFGHFSYFQCGCFAVERGGLRVCCGNLVKFIDLDFEVTILNKYSNGQNKFKFYFEIFD